MQQLTSPFLLKYIGKKILVSQDDIHLNQSYSWQNFFHRIFPLIKVSFVFSAIFLCHYGNIENQEELCISNEGLPDFIGDGYCDDSNNNPECYFDAGDCCFNVDTKYCTECNCLASMYN